MDAGTICIIAALVIAIINLTMWLIEVKSDYDAAALALMCRQFENPHGQILGKVVEAKIYEDSDWERMVVVAVSWRGAVCVRPTSDDDAPGRWIRKEVVGDRVREVRRWD